MSVTSAEWFDAAQTMIKASIGGISMFVPDEQGNRERRLIAEWEAAGNTIAAYTPPPAPPRTIAGAYFRAALANMNELDRVRAALANSIDLELFNGATSFSEADADVIAVASALNIDLAAVFDEAFSIRAARQNP